HLARTIELLTHRCVIFGAGDRVTCDACDIRAVVEEVAKALNADEAEPWYDEDHQQEHHQAFVVTKEVEHEIGRIRYAAGKADNQQTLDITLPRRSGKSPGRQC
ncbi:hypothetical protein DFQ30_005393, partial [Apophysomyces sp. BC1015]